MNVTPAILPKSFGEINEKIDRLSGIAKDIQIDLCDGKMGVEKTWLPEGNEQLKDSDSIAYECDFMVYDWKSHMDKILSLPFKRIIFHIDMWSLEDIDECLLLIKDKGITPGFAVSNSFSINEFDEKIRYLEEKGVTFFIQVMGIERIGEQGQEFDVSCIDRIKHLRHTFTSTHMQVDGAMRPETVRKVGEAGANSVVVGSYLLRHDDISSAYSELSSIEVEVCN